jgi:hypothetical protein
MTPRTALHDLNFLFFAASLAQTTIKPWNCESSQLFELGDEVLCDHHFHTLGRLTWTHGFDDIGNVFGPRKSDSLVNSRHAGRGRLPFDIADVDGGVHVLPGAVRILPMT